MKKYILCAAAALFTLGAFAQSTSDLLKDIEDQVITGEERIKAKKEKEWKVFDGSLLSTYGFGYHSVLQPEFTADKRACDEFYMNLGEFRYSPVEHLALTAGLDLRWDSFETTSESFSVGSDNLVSVVPLSSTADRNYSEIRFTSLATPFRLRADLGIFSLQAGVDLFFRTRRSVINTAETGNMTTETSWKKVGANKFGWDVSTSVEVFGIGFYYRYYPQGAFPAGGMNLKYHTFGLYYSFL